MGVNSRPTVPEAVNIGRCGGPSRPTRRPEASRSRPKTRGNDPPSPRLRWAGELRTPKAFASRSLREQVTKPQIRKGPERALRPDLVELP